MTQARNGTPPRREPLAPDLSALDDRSVRAWTEPMTVRQLPDDRYAVDGKSGATYVVDLEQSTCSCPDHVIRGERCKHLRRTAIEVTRGRVPSPRTRPRFCAVCGGRLKPADGDEPPLCAACGPEPGEIVLDRGTGSRLLVVEVTANRADEVEIPDRGWTVADHPTNRGYDPDDPVIEAVYVEDIGEKDSPRRYSFPVSRIARREQTTA